MAIKHQPTSKRRPNVSETLAKTGISSLISMIEIHNKPLIENKYQTCSILMCNAWEMLLKALIYKINKKDLFRENGQTISLDEAAQLLVNKTNFLKRTIAKANIEGLIVYRNIFIHFSYDKKVDEILFALLYKSVLLIFEFIKLFFPMHGKKIETLNILPIGFSLPIDPLSIIQTINSNHPFITKLVALSNELHSNGVSESIFVNFALQNVNNIKNAEIVAGVDKESTTKIAITKNVNITTVPGSSASPKIIDTIPDNYKYTYHDLYRELRRMQTEIKQGKKYSEIIRNNVKVNNQACYKRILNPKNKNSPVTFFYSDYALEIFVEEWNK